MIDMKLIDESPGGFLAAACVFVYATVLTETWMITTTSIAAMVGTFLLIIVLACVLTRTVLALMGPEDHPDAPAPPAPAKDAAPARAATPARPPVPVRPHAAH